MGTADNSWIGDTKCRAKITTTCEVTWNIWEICERSWCHCMSHHASKIPRSSVVSLLGCLLVSSSFWLVSLFKCTHIVAQVWVSVHPMVIFMIHAHCERCFWSLRLLHSFHLLPHHLSDHLVFLFSPDTFNFHNVGDECFSYFRWVLWHLGRERASYR